MSIGNYLDISTAYITRRDMTLLIEGFGPVIATYPEGAIVSSTYGNEDGLATRREQRELLTEAGFSERFVDLLEYAADRGCYLVRIDMEGDVQIPGLDCEEWSREGEVEEVRDLRAELAAINAKIGPGGDPGPYAERRHQILQRLAEIGE